MSSIAELRQVAAGGRVDDFASAVPRACSRQRGLRVPVFGMIIGIATVLAGCAVQPQSAPLLGYRCDDGREFSLRISPATETAEIEIARMRFGLLADPAAGPGEKFSCSVLTLWREGNMARVEMDGTPQFSNCRLQR